LILLGGEPGIGKSTLILQLCEKVQGEGKVLYVSGEESAEQIKLRADRLDVKSEELMFLGETDIDIVKEAISEMQPKLVIIDSIQTMYSDEITAAAGSVSQVREITAQIMRVCKAQQITTIIIGHVTKEGNIAGPRVLEHMVDTVLYLEGERYNTYRILRAVKNRFGSTNEIGMFEMRQEGMCEVTNPSDILITEREDNPSGSCIIASIEGTRPILVENASINNKSFKRRRENSEILIRYNTTLSHDHEISALGGFTTSYYNENYFDVTRKGMSDWSLTQLKTATELVSSDSNETDWALISYFGRLNYAFKGRYLFEANVRYDGSSRFAPESRWGVFPIFLCWLENK